MKRISYLLLLTASLAGCYGHRNPVKTGLEGQLLPSFTILAPDSITRINIGTLMEGKPAILFYFSARCPYCRAQMEGIIKNLDQLEGIKLFVFTSSFNEMKSFYNHYNLGTYSNIITGSDFRNFFIPYFKVPVVPCTAIYGRDKRLRQVFMGKISPQQIRESVGV
jgi:hypothetical protein